MIQVVHRTEAAPAPAPPYTMPDDSWRDVDSDDFTLVEKPQELLALRPRTGTHRADQASVEIHPRREDDAFIISVRPPTVPVYGLTRASCDIVLVIDVSRSMAAAAPLPEAVDGADKEAAGLSVLDLVKHASKAILETLGPDDRLGIVTFSGDATVKIESGGMFTSR